MYQRGLGVQQDFAEAVRLYRNAADQGEPLAQNNLGIMYATGQGIPKDNVQALMWFSLAASAGNQIAAGNRDKVVEFMSPTEIAEAQSLTRGWRPQPVSGPSILIRPLKAGSSP
jgi:TPR repeat protein